MGLRLVVTYLKVVLPKSSVMTAAPLNLRGDLVEATDPRWTTEVSVERNSRSTHYAHS